MLGPIRRVRFTKAALRQANIRDNKGLSLGKLQVKVPHQRSPYAMKLEDRSPGVRQERCARGDAWELAKNIFKLKKEGKATFDTPSEEWILPGASTINSEEREFVVDSGTSMHGQQERLEESRIGNREDIEKSNDGGDGQRRGANKRRGNGIRPRIGFIRDSDAS